MPSILQRHLGEIIQHFNHLLGWQIVLSFHIVHEASEVTDFGGQEAVFVTALGEEC